MCFIHSFTDAVPNLGEGQVEWTWTWRDIKPLNTAVLIYLHVAGIQAFFNLPSCWQTYLFQFIILLGSGFGVSFCCCYEIALFY